MPQSGDMPAAVRCLNESEECTGKVEYHSYGQSMRVYPRCEFHHQKRVATEDGINKRYPYLQPADFDPAFAGERWTDDD